MLPLQRRPKYWHRCCNRPSQPLRWLQVRAAAETVRKTMCRSARPAAAGTKRRRRCRRSRHRSRGRCRQEVEEWRNPPTPPHLHRWRCSRSASTGMATRTQNRSLAGASANRRRQHGRRGGNCRRGYIQAPSPPSQAAPRRRQDVGGVGAPSRNRFQPGGWSTECDSGASAGGDARKGGS